VTARTIPELTASPRKGVAPKRIHQPLAHPHTAIGVMQNSHHQPPLSRMKNLHATALSCGARATFVPQKKCQDSPLPIHSLRHRIVAVLVRQLIA
jgi:hypothetical protein